MSRSKRVTLIVVLVIAGLCSAAYGGFLWLDRWATVTDSTITRAYGSPDRFAPAYAPTGSWQVCIDGPAAIRDRLTAALKRDLPAVTQGPTDIKFLTAVPAMTAPGGNTLIVKLTAEGIWTPVVGTFKDKAEVIIVAGGDSIPLDDQQVVPGMVRITIAYAAAGKGYGLIGRPQMNAARAKIASDFITKAIRDSYDEIRSKGH